MQKKCSNATFVTTKPMWSFHWQSILQHTIVRNHSNVINVILLVILRTVSIAILKKFTHRKNSKKNSNAIYVTTRPVRSSYWQNILQPTTVKSRLNAINATLLAILRLGFSPFSTKKFFSTKVFFWLSFVSWFRIYVPKWSIRSLRVTLGRLKFHYHI